MPYNVQQLANICWGLLRVAGGGMLTNLRSAAVLIRYRIAASTLHKVLKALDDRGIAREEEVIGAIRHRLEDPFLAHWLRIAQAG